MKTQKLYKIALKAMKEVEPVKNNCNNCFVYKLQRELEKEHFEINFHNYHGSDCSNPLFYLEDLGIIKILSGVANRMSGVYCDQLEIKLLSNPDGNKIWKKKNFTKQS